MAGEQRCYFFKLPRELRDYIYEEVLIHKSVLELYPSGDPVEKIDEWELTDRSWALFRPSEPSLVRTCRQIREEALPSFYGANIFRDTTYHPCCLRFLRWLTPATRMMLKQVRISHCTGLGFLDDQTYYAACVVTAKERLQHVQAWLQQNDLKLSKDAIHVFTKLSDDTMGLWTNSPNGVCALGQCCGNEKKARLICD